MINQELIELHNSKKKDILYSQRLARRTHGFNFATPIPEQLTKKYKIHLSVEQKQTFKGVEVSWKYDINLPSNVCSHSYYWGNNSPVSFLKDFEWYCQTPRYDLLKENNRKDKWGWGFPKLRDVTFDFAEFDIQISELGKSILSTSGVDFEFVIKSAIDSQRDATPIEIKLLEEYVLLNEKKRTLKLFEEERQYGYYGNRVALKKFKMTKKQYEKALASIESRISVLSSKLQFLGSRKEDRNNDDDEALDSDEDTEYCDDCGNAIDECQC